MIVASFLMAAGAAAKHYGPTLHIHHGLPNSIRGPLHWLGLSLSGTEFAILFIALGVCYLGVLSFADSVKLRVGVGAILALHLIFVIAPPLLSSDLFNYVGYARLDAVHRLNPTCSRWRPRPPTLLHIRRLAPPHHGIRPALHSRQPAARLGQLPGGDLAPQVSHGLASLACVALVWALRHAARSPGVAGGALLRAQPGPARLRGGRRPQRSAHAGRRARGHLPDARRARVGDGGAGGGGGREELIGGAPAVRPARLAAAGGGRCSGVRWRRRSSRDHGVAFGHALRASCTCCRGRAARDAERHPRGDQRRARPGSREPRRSAGSGCAS